MSSLSSGKTHYKSMLVSGTRGRTRTGTVFTPVDFESTASTNFATLASLGAPSQGPLSERRIIAMALAHATKSL